MEARDLAGCSKMAAKWSQAMFIQFRKFTHQLFVAVLATFIATYFASEAAASTVKYRTLGRAQGRAWSVLFSPDGRSLVIRRELPDAQGIYDYDEAIEVWDVQRRRLKYRLTQLKMKVFFNSVCFSPDSRVLALVVNINDESASRSHTDIRLLVARTGKLLKTIPARSDFVEGLAFWPANRMLTGLTRAGIKVWDVRTGKLVRLWPQPFGPMLHIAFSPNRKMFATVDNVDTSASQRQGRDTGARLYNIRSGKLMRVLEKQSSEYTLIFSPDGQTLAMGTGSIRLWNVKTGRLFRTIQLPEKNPNVPRYLHTLAFSPDGGTLAGGGGESIRTALWSARTGKLLYTLPEKPNQEYNGANNVAFSPNGRLLAVANDNGTVRLWRLR